MSKTWGIIGLGWLGSELSIRLEKLNHQTWGTHLKDFNFRSDPFPKKSSDVLFLNTPPLIDMPPKQYVDKIEKSTHTKVVFISSTSVYGLNSGLINESSVASPQTASARWLLDVELKLKDKFRDDLIIIRPGGLIGGDRHPVFSLSQSQKPISGQQVINFIHRLDLIEISLAAVNAGNVHLINAVAPHHPKKEDYYNEWTDRLNLPRLNYTSGTETLRQIDSEILPGLYPNWICPKLDFL